MDAKGLAQRPWVMALGLAIVTFAVFSPALANGFVQYDDPKYVYENPRVLEGLTAGNVQWAFTTGFFNNWHPLTWLSHMLDAQIFGAAPAGHHGTSIWFHALNAGLVVLVLTRLTGNPLLSLIAAALFALHPLRVESVAWVSERKDVLSMFFGLLCIYAYAGYAKAPSLARYALVVFWLALGLMSKPMLVTWPFVLLLLDFWPLRRFSSFADGKAIGRCLLEKAPFLILVALSSWITVVVQSQGAIASFASYPLSVRLENMPVAYVRYLVHFIWPSGLTFHYAHPEGALRATDVTLAVVCLAIITGAALLAVRKAPYALVGWLWFVGTLVPVIGLVQVGGAAMADRYTYVPAIGLSIALVWLGADAAARIPKSRAALIALTAIVLAVFSAVTVRQIGTWRNSEVLFQRAIAIDENNSYAHFLLGSYVAGEGRLEEGQQHLERSVMLTPSFYLALNDLGAVYKRQGKHLEAETLFRGSIESNPGFGTAYMNLGDLLAHTGRVEEGLAFLRKALELIPETDPNRAAVANYIPQLEQWLRDNAPQDTPAS